MYVGLFVLHQANVHEKSFCYYLYNEYIEEAYSLERKRRRREKNLLSNQQYSVKIIKLLYQIYFIASSEKINRVL